ncbi:MAG: hypothetical protein J4G09_12165 [Proteobacteria bacterium]|nr:hypothetical protein [Pseudomonadota bacterium]
MTSAQDRPYLFHAFEVSYFSAKVRPALRYKRLWYDEVHADYRLIRERTGLAGTGWEGVLAHEPRHRVAKRGYRLVLADD